MQSLFSSQLTSKRINCTVLKFEFLYGIDQLKSIGKEKLCGLCVKKDTRCGLQQVFFKVAEDVFSRQDADELAVPDHRKMAVTTDRHGMKRVSDGGVF